VANDTDRDQCQVLTAEAHQFACLQRLDPAEDRVDDVSGYE